MFVNIFFDLTKKISNKLTIFAISKATIYAFEVFSTAKRRLSFSSPKKGSIINEI